MREDVLKKYFNDEVDFKRLKYDDDFEYKESPQLFEVLNSIKNKTVLSLGCGTGRELKFLIKNKNKVVGIDIAEKVIEKSKKIEPKAEYHCMDLVKYQDKRKYDYILALNSVMDYIIKKENRIKVANNCIDMLKKDGRIILELNLLNLKDKFKLIVAPIIALILGEYKYYNFGDIYYRKFNDKGEKIYFVKTHLYTLKELRKLFKNMNFEFIKERDMIYLIKINN